MIQISPCGQWGETVQEWCNMITVKVHKNGLEVNGHAGIAPCGRDIVCAGVSAITLTLLHGLEEIARMEVESISVNGYVSVEWEKLNEVGKALVDTWYLGMCDIADEYQNCIKFM